MPEAGERAVRANVSWTTGQWAFVGVPEVQMAVVVRFAESRPCPKSILALAKLWPIRGGPNQIFEIITLFTPYKLHRD